MITGHLTSSLVDHRERRRTRLLTVLPAEERARVERLWRIDQLVGEVETWNITHGKEAQPPDLLIRLTRKLGGDVEAIVSDTHPEPGTVLHDALMQLAETCMTPLELDDE